MNQDYLKAWVTYHNAVGREMMEFEKYSDKFIVDQKTQVVGYHIFLETMEGRQPNQTDLIYELNISEQAMRIILKRLLELNYIKLVKGKDSRFKHYQSTEALKYGVEVHTARQVITILDVAKSLKLPTVGLLATLIQNGLGEYKKFPAYGAFDLETVKTIISEIESKK